MQTNSDSSQSSHHNDNHGQGFFYRPEVIQWILRIFYTLCVLLVVVDFFIHRHIETAIEKVPAFYAIYGFIACVVLVLIANQMRKVLMRDENYYQQYLSSSDMPESGDLDENGLGKNSVDKKEGSVDE